jgi:coproporphyrinogen III oxidase
MHVTSFLTPARHHIRTDVCAELLLKNGKLFEQVGVHISVGVSARCKNILYQAQWRGQLLEIQKQELHMCISTQHPLMAATSEITDSQKPISMQHHSSRK